MVITHLGEKNCHRDTMKVLIREPCDYYSNERRIAGVQCLFFEAMFLSFLCHEKQLHKSIQIHPLYINIELGN